MAKRVPGQRQGDIGKRVIYDRFQLHMEVGVGLGGVDVLVQGYDPQVMLRWSDDGGQTWTQPLLAAAGKVGEYSTRVIWRRLGQARDRVFEIVISDPVEAVLVSAYVDVNVGLQ